MTIDNQEDLDGLLRIGHVVAEARDAIVAVVQPGITTGELDALGAEVFRRHGARSAPILDYRFPGTNCISVNDEAAHGIPSPTRVLHEGDLVNLEVSAELDGYYADTGISIGVGTVSGLARNLLEAKPPSCTSVRLTASQQSPLTGRIAVHLDRYVLAK